MPKAEPEDTLLCERCGYRIEGLPRERPCPECGRPIRDSLPAARPGSAWQRERGLRARLRTAACTLRHPGQTFQTIGIRGRLDEPLLAGNIALASLLTASALWLAILRAMWLSEGFLDPGTLLGAAAFATILGGYGSVIGLHILTAIEHRGVRFFAARRGWRITADVATSICAHASAGWLVAGVLVLLGTLLGMWAGAWTADAPAWLRPALRRAPATAPLAGFFAGLLVFETLVYVGVRRCRFANA